MKSFIQYIIEESKKTSPCYAKFEKFVFGELLGKSEYDTNTERKISNDIEHWFSDGGASMKQKKQLVDAFKQLLACKNEYPDELSPEGSVETIYRGISVGDKQLMRWLGNKIQVEGETTVKGEKYAISKPFNYVAGADLESWSSKINIAHQFSATYGGDIWEEMKKNNKNLKRQIDDVVRCIKKLERYPDDLFEQDKFLLALDDLGSWLNSIEFDIRTKGNNVYSVIFMMKPDKGCVFSPKFSNKIAWVSGFGKESEVVRVNVGQSNKAQLMFPAQIANMSEIMDELREVFASIPDVSAYRKMIKHSDTSSVYSIFNKAKAKLEKLL